MNPTKAYVKVFTRIVDYFTVITIICVDSDHPYPMVLSNFAFCNDVEIDSYNWINIFSHNYELECIKDVIRENGGFYFNGKFIKQ